MYLWVRKLGIRHLLPGPLNVLIEVSPALTITSSLLQLQPSSHRRQTLDLVIELSLYLTIRSA